MTRTPSDADAAIARDVCEQLDAVAATRGQWESVWEQIAERMFTQYAKQFVNRNTAALQGYGGVQRTEEQVDSTAALALTRFAAAMESMLTPRSSTWHYLKPSDRAVLKNREARLWYEEVNRLLFEYRYAPNANFASQKHEDYLMLGAFGTGCLFIDPLQHHAERGVRYRAVHLGQMYFQENHQGLIDTALRKFTLTARQAVQQFGADALPEKITREASSGKTATRLHEFVHCVKPRRVEEGYDPSRADLMGMPFASHYVSCTEPTLLKSGGYFTFPYAISRYVVAPGETYGRSPGMMALPTIKVLNEQKKTLLKQGHRTVDPVLLAHDDGVVDAFSLRPGAVNYGGVTAEGRPLVHALPTGNLALGQEMMDAEVRTINDFFLVTLFQILIETPTMTATEVLERAREKGALLSPTMGRQQSEALGPMIEREIDVLVQQKLLPPMPQAVLETQGRYTVQYDSPLSRMARAEEAAGFMRSLETALRMVEVTQDPAPLDHYDMDAIMPDLMDIYAMPVRWRRSLDQVEQIRQGRQQQQQTQQMIEAAPAAASVMKSVMPMATK
jgi:hypothetical protein